MDYNNDSDYSDNELFDTKTIRSEIEKQIKCQQTSGFSNSRQRRIESNIKILKCIEEEKQKERNYYDSMKILNSKEWQKLNDPESKKHIKSEKELKDELEINLLNSLFEEEEKKKKKYSELEYIS